MTMFSRKAANNLVSSNALIEAFRSLITNIDFVSIQKEIRTLVFTSGNKNEGKSTVVANYGISLAERGFRCLIVDCDLRNPTQQELFGLRNDLGMTEVLLESVSLEKAVKATAHENLWLLTAGMLPYNPAGVLTSLRMSNLMEHLKQEYEMVIFDTCPLGIAADASIMAAAADGTVLIVRAGATSRNTVKRSVRALELAKANLLGVVLNQVGCEMKDDNYYYGY